jgi:hypothetical protein
LPKSGCRISAARTIGRSPRSACCFRPHPANARQWFAFDHPSFPDAAIWPPIGTDPNAPTSAATISIRCITAAAVVGINTSAQLEAAIVGRPVFTIRAPEFAHAQEGTLHFQHLLQSKAAWSRARRRFDAHVRQLERTLSGAFDREAQRRFVRAFIRPRGLDAPAAPAFVDAVESIHRGGRTAPQSDSAAVVMMRPLAAGLARVARLLADDRPAWAYLLRPAVTAAVWIAAPVFWIRESAGEAAATAMKRLRPTGTPRIVRCLCTGARGCSGRTAEIHVQSVLQAG